MVSKIMPYELEDGPEKNMAEDDSVSLREEYLSLNEKYQTIRNRHIIWKKYALEFKQELEKYTMESKELIGVEL